MEDETFPGFDLTYTTAVPDALFDVMLSKLSGAEIKVMLYIIRRTIGFHKVTDAISLTQFENGITTKDGKVLDKGCGLNRETIGKALKSLETKNCIIATRRNTDQGDKDITIYSLHFKEGAKKVVGKTDQGERKNVPPNTANVGGKSAYGGRKISVGVSGKSDLQEESDSQHTELQETESTNPPADTTTNTSIILSSSEQLIYDFYCQIGTRVKVSEAAKSHCAELAPHIHSLDDMKALYAFVEPKIHGSDKTVYLGNMVKHIKTWLHNKPVVASPEPEQDENELVLWSRHKHEGSIEDHWYLYEWMSLQEARNYDYVALISQSLQNEIDWKLEQMAEGKLKLPQGVMV